jgi:ribose transport system permease protein
VSSSDENHKTGDEASGPNAAPLNASKEKSGGVAHLAPARLIRSLEQLGVPAVLVVLIVVFSIALPATFPTSRNLSGLLSTEDIVILVALGAIAPLIAGEFDLSIGYVLGFTSMEVAVLTLNHGMNVWLASIIAICTAMLIGLVNAFLVLKLRISSFIATLASGTVLSGLTLLLSNSTIVTGVFPNDFVKLGFGGPGGVPPAVYIVGVVGILLIYMTEHTPVGRRLEAIGQGRDAARLAGLKVDRLVLLSLVMSAGVCGIAGVLNTAAQGSASPGTGPEFLLPALAASFLGSTTIRPGRFNILGTVFSVLLLAVGFNGLSQLGAPQWVSPVFDGGVLIIAVGLTRGRVK